MLNNLLNSEFGYKRVNLVSFNYQLALPWHVNHTNEPPLRHP